jgi:DNA-binding transcriptional LysR family regulator
VFDLNEVLMFVETSKAGGFAKGSRRLRIPPSRMSQKIQKLEDRLGTQLLRRSTPKVSLTDARQRACMIAARARSESIQIRGGGVLVSLG